MYALINACLFKIHLEFFMPDYYPERYIFTVLLYFMAPPFFIPRKRYRAVVPDTYIYGR